MLKKFHKSREEEEKNENFEEDGDRLSTHIPLRPIPPGW
jgi:hypothetical protein